MMDAFFDILSAKNFPLSKWRTSRTLPNVPVPLRALNEIQKQTEGQRRAIIAEYQQFISVL